MDLPPFGTESRARWEAVADHLLDSVVPFASPGFALISLPGRRSAAGALSDGLEGFARTFLLAGFRIGGARGAVPSALVERYAEGLATGTDPASPFAWPALADLSQQLVEAASIALALHETRPWLFDRLSPAVRGRVVDWLAGFAGKRVHDNNWVLFRVVVGQFLASVGGPHDPAEIAADVARVERWYVGDGWYTDGDGANFDFYCGWAMHLYTVLWARMAGDRARLDGYRERLRAFLGHHRLLFAPDGAPVHHGRSLTYRFATVAPFWLGALVDATPLAPGETRRLANATLRHFVERGAPDDAGLLSLGWHRPFLPTTQPYSGPGSPYWASKAFLGLLLPPEHPVWTAPEETSLVEPVVALPEPGWLVQTTGDGIVRLLNHGTDHHRTGDPHYAKLAYSTHTGPGFESTVDGHVAVVGPSGVPSRRERIDRIGPGASGYSATIPEGPVEVRTASLVRGAWEVRVHRVTAPAGCVVRDGGYAVADDPAVVVTRHAVATSPDGLTSAVVALHGWEAAGVAREEAGTAFGPASAAPYVVSGPVTSSPSWHVSLVVLSRSAVSPEDLADAVRVDVGANRVAITFPGEDAVAVALEEVAGNEDRRCPRWFLE